MELVLQTRIQKETRPCVILNTERNKKIFFYREATKDKFNIWTSVFFASTVNKKGENNYESGSFY